MPLYEIKVTSTVICHGIEADTEAEAEVYVLADLSTRFSAFTEIVAASTIVEDVTE